MYRRQAWLRAFPVTGDAFLGNPIEASILAVATDGDIVASGLYGVRSRSGTSRSRRSARSMSGSLTRSRGTVELNDLEVRRADPQLPRPGPALDDPGRVHHAGLGELLAQAVDVDEIGRASCRERVSSPV